MAGVQTLLGRLSTGAGGALTVVGEPGIGKSALLDHALTGIDDTVRVLTAVVPEGGSPPPFAGLRRLLLPVRAVRDRLPAQQRDLLAAVGGPSETGTHDPFAVALAALNLLAEAAAHRPVLMVVEDAHRLDEASSAVLGFVARRLAGEPLVLLAAMREGYRTPLESAGLPVLRLGPLDAVDAETVVHGLAPDLPAGLRERVLAEAGGNPLALTRLTRIAGEACGEAAAVVWPADAARSEQTLRTRLASLPPRTRLLLLIAAVHTDGASSALLDAAQVITGEAAHPEDLAPAVRTRLVALEKGRLRFRHPLVRTAVLSGADRSALRRVREALASDRAGFGERPERPGETARHRSDDSVALLVEAVTERIEHRDTFLSEVAAGEGTAPGGVRARDRAEPLLRATALALETGQHEEVARLLHRARAHPLSARQKARARWLSDRLEENAEGNGPDVVALIALAERVAAEGEGGLALRVLWAAAQRCFWSGSGGDAGPRVAEAAQRLADDDGPPALAVLAAAAPVSCGERVAARLEYWAAHPGGDATADRLLGTAALLTGSFELAASFSAAALPGLRAQGRQGSLAKALAVRAWSSALLCDPTVAGPSAAEAVRLCQETGQPLLYASSRAAQALVAAFGGRLDEAASRAREAVDLGAALRARPVLATARTALAHVAAARDRFDEALDQLRHVHDPSAAAFHPVLGHYGLIDLVDTAQRAHRADEVQEMVRRAEEAAAVTPATALHIGLRFARAVLAEEDADAEELFRQALGADLTRWPFARARTQLAYGEWLRRRRREAQARTPLRDARDAFDALGAVVFAERARKELRASGEASPERTPNARELLSPQELQIALMVAEGMTNREIGERLYLSHRTVSGRLHRIFPRLGVTSRAALGRLLRTTAAAQGRSVSPGSSRAALRVVSPRQLPPGGWSAASTEATWAAVPAAGVQQ
ncbi:LuxR family transcriptional regulator [Streptomyces fumigatiscleroticus]|nr:LuxR family transcriptional regulator [Streptomyces fumigatiscleroticus]